MSKKWSTIVRGGGRKIMKKVILVMIPLLIFGSILLAGCGISKDTYDSVVAERDATQKEFVDLQAKLDNLIVAGDTVRGHIPSEWGPICPLTSQWHRGEMIVWRFRIWDPETGNQLPGNPVDLVATQPDKDALTKLVEGITATVHLSDGQSFPARFGPHGGEEGAKADYFWTTSWEIPADYPTGTLEDWVTVEWAAGGKTGTSQPFKVSLSMLTILE